MLDDDKEKSKSSLAKVQKICRMLNIALWIIFSVLFVFWCISVGSIVFAIGDQPQSRIPSFIYSLFLCIGFGVIVAVTFVIFSKFFTDVSKGDSPFSMKQVKRLRVISAMLLAYFIFDTLISSNSMLMQVNGFDSGYMTTNNTDNAYLTINFASFIAAAVVFAFSFVFKYGVLLQEFSDETL